MSPPPTGLKTDRRKTAGKLNPKAFVHLTTAKIVDGHGAENPRAAGDKGVDPRYVGDSIREKLSDAAIGSTGAQTRPQDLQTILQGDARSMEYRAARWPGSIARTFFSSRSRRARKVSLFGTKRSNASSAFGAELVKSSAFKGACGQLESCSTTLVKLYANNSSRGFRQGAGIFLERVSERYGPEASANRIIRSVGKRSRGYGPNDTEANWLACSTGVGGVSSAPPGLFEKRVEQTIVK